MHEYYGRTRGGGIVLRHVISPSLKCAHVENCLGKSVRSFLRQVVADATGNDAVCVFAQELLRVRAGVWMRRAIRIALQRDRRDTDRWRGGEPRFHFVIPGLAVSQAKSPAIVVDHNVYVIRIVEGRCAPIECGVVEVQRGEAVCQMSLAKSRRYRSYPERPRSVAK